MPRLARAAWAAALLLVALGSRPALAEDAGTGDSPARPFYAEAENHREAGRTAEAADAYWKALEADRGFYEAHVGYQAASLANGVARADLIADYDSFVKDFPDDLPLKLHRLRLDEPQDRIKAIDKLGREVAKDPNVAWERAWAYLELGQADKAVKLIDAFTKPEAPERFLVLLVRALARDGKGKQAEKELEGQLDRPGVALEAARLALALGENEQAVQRADTVLAGRPGSTAACLIKAEALFQAGKADQAIEALTVGRRATDDAVPVQIALGDLVGRGEDAEKALPAAAEIYEGVLKAHPEDARALYGLAWVRERQQKYDEAEKLYRQAASVLPTDPSVAESIGYALFKQGRITDAQVQFRKAIDMDPSYASAYANIGATHDAKAEYAKAIEWYEKLLKLPGQKENIRALVNCAFDHEQLGAFPKAESYLRKAHELRPRDPDILVWLADNLYFQEKWKDAERTYLQAIDLDEKSFYAWRGLGMTYGQLGKWSDAAAALERARKLKPTDADLLLMLGGVYMQELEDLEKALECFEAYVQNGGDDPEVIDVMTEIRRQLADKKKR